MDGSEYVIKTDFLNKFSRIILYLCELLEEMCVEDQSGLYTQIEEMIEIYLRDRDSHSKLDINQNQEISGRKAETNVNIRKSCLIIHNNSIDDLDNFTNNLINNYYDKKYHGYNYYYMQSEEIANVIEAGMSDLKENGYACVLFMSDVEECHRQKQSIEDYLVSEAVPQSLNCRIVSVYRLYFMRLAQILMGVIYEYCFGKTQLCNILSDIVYKRTMLAHNFVINEHLLLKDFRSEMIVRILGIAKYSDTGRIYAAALFLNNIHTLYDHLISDNIRNNKSFLILIEEIVYSPPVVVYLVENGFLCKMIDILSDSLKKIGIKAGIDVVNLYKHKPIQQVLVRVLETSKLLNGLLQISLNDIEVYSKFRMRLLEAGKRLIQFCLDFDNMQPSRKINSKKTERKDYDCLISLYASLVKIFSGMVKWLVYFDVVGRKILELFLKRFQEDIKRISEENSVDNLTSTIIKFCNAETENFSIFNLSHRVFIDLLMGCCVKGTLSGDIKEKIFGDENMLMWISRPAITALLAITNVVTFKSGKQHENLEHLIFVYSKPNISYLYMQDFYAIQILISNLNPDLCLKYMPLQYKKV
ncbi:hypothetical protein RF11_03001 [Thelohanellus kitauei]|uniref:Uncharacterized protein n=1 Tax=Thelohanellus kitauei TaxID=669202 RepID=A0A0C2I6H4_THEKT|nr:hypothetical protein RF11_03001 [Thelohanellus kitauei]